MLVRALVALWLASASLAYVTKRQNDLAPFEEPKSKKVTEILAIGDSYTAGIGSNGKKEFFTDSGSCSRYMSSWPSQLQQKSDWKDVNDGDHPNPKLTFGACSGALIKNMTDFQLKQDGQTAEKNYTTIGKPQIAVMTIGGNDLGFSKIVQACIYNPYGNEDKKCDGLLKNAEDKAKSPAFKEELKDAIDQVIRAGREAKGADPPQAFKLYMGGYVGFWNHDDDGCNDIQWSFWYGGKLPIVPKGRKLTKEFRRRMNDIVDDLNKAISGAVGDKASVGVHYVSGFQSQYDGHRFCEPSDKKDYLRWPTGKQTWFWHAWSKHWDDGLEETVINADNEMSDQSMFILEQLIPDKDEREKTIKGEKTDNPMFKSEDAFADAIKKNELAATAYDGDDTYRIFHPKGTGYGPYATSFMNDIKRDLGIADKPPPPALKTYQSGQCFIQLENFWDPCNLEQFTGDVYIKDGGNRIIGSISGADIGKQNHLALTSELPLVLDIKAMSDMVVNFNYGGLAFDSRMDKKKSPDGYCSHGGWDPRQWPGCWDPSRPGGEWNVGDGPKPQKAGISCWFKCD